MKKLFMVLAGALMMFTLTGCLYPEKNLTKNQIAYKDQIASVQTAVNQFREDSGGLLPIKDREMGTPIFQKYPVEFNKLIPKYMQEPPGTAFESGGVFAYVLVDVETNPTVKLLDLRIAEKIREIKIKINSYRLSSGYPPFKDMIAKGVFTIDYQKLGYKETLYVESPYSGKNLPLIIDSTGEIFVDYSMDLYEALQEGEHNYKSGDDIRSLLVEHSDFVPAYSLPYTIDTQKNEPVFLEK